MLKRKILFCVFVAFVGFASAQSANDRIIVKFKRNFVETKSLDKAESINFIKKDNICKIGVIDFDALAQKYKVSNLKRVFRYAGKFEKKHKEFDLDLFYEVKFDGTSSIESALSDFSAIDIIESVEAVPLYKVNKQPDDTRFYGYQWGLYNRTNEGIDINVMPAWEVTTGDPRVVVAVIDNCFDYQHEDLRDNLWTNPDEIPDNNIDDDENGHVDDIMGWNFRDNSPDVNYEFPRDQHGTHVGGIVAARSNNGKGIAGVAGGWGDNKGISMMVFRAGGSNEEGQENIGYGYEAMIYAADKGAAIAQCSWGGPDNYSAGNQAINYFTATGGGGAMQGGLVIAAAGNDYKSIKNYPAANSKVLSVGSIDYTGYKSDFSNYGDFVDICAPGSDIMSCLPNSTYGSLQGTSMACPMVSGVAALVLSAAYDVIPKESKTPDWLKDVLISTAVTTQIVYNIGGLVNAKAALDYAVGPYSGNELLKPAFNVSLYPNPASDALNIVTDFNEHYDYNIYDISGRLITSRKNQSNNQKIDISGYDNGAYVFIVAKDNKQVVKTFIKK